MELNIHDNPFLALDRSNATRFSMIESDLLEIKSLLRERPLLDENRERYVTKKEGANLASVSTSTIDNWAREGKITRYYFGGSVRFWLPELMEFLQSQKVA